MEKKNLKFEELSLSANIKKALRDCKYVEATDIQAQAIPVILDGRDVIGQSKTGTGKTASYSLPMLDKVDSKSRDVQAIVLCPTRELAIQITEEIRKFNKYQEGIRCVTIYGGQSIETQIKALKGGVQIIIGTPGRVMDHMRRKTLKLNNVKMVVLDEADEMLNMGFEEDIEVILKDVPKDRQTLLFSATMNKRILGITKKYLKEPKNIKIKAEELTVNNIEQTSISIKSGMKDEAVTRLIDTYAPKKAIVFCNTKRKVDDLIGNLKSKGYRAESLHGDIQQNQRDRIMRRLKQGEFQILVATDVAARGIDVDELELVINYDVPQEEEYYVHRIGRTGRNGGAGKAVTFVVGREKDKIYSIQRYANTKIKEGKIPTLDEVNEIRNKQTIDNIQKIIDKKEYSNINILESLLKNNDIKEVAKALMTMSIGNGTHISEEETKYGRGIDKPARYNLSKDGYIKLFLSLGKKDNIMAKDIVGSFSSNVAMSGSDIGKINILDKFTFVEIPNRYVNEVMNGMREKQIKGKEVRIEVANSN